MHPIHPTQTVVCALASEMSGAGSKRKASTLTPTPNELGDEMFTLLEDRCTDGNGTWNYQLRNGAVARFLDYEDIPESMGFDRGTTSRGVWTAGRILSRAKNVITGFLQSAGSRFAGVRSILHSVYVYVYVCVCVCVFVRARVCLSYTIPVTHRCGECLVHSRRFFESGAKSHGSVERYVE